MRGLFWLLVIAAIVVGPLLIVQFDVINLTTEATEVAVVTVKDKTEEVMATRAAEGRVSDRIRQAGEGIQADSKVAEIELKIHAGINAERGVTAGFRHSDGTTAWRPSPERTATI